MILIWNAGLIHRERKYMVVDCSAHLMRISQASLKSTDFAQVEKRNGRSDWTGVFYQSKKSILFKHGFWQLNLLLKDLLVKIVASPLKFIRSSILTDHSERSTTTSDS